MQLSNLCRKKTCIFTYFLLLAFMFWNFLSNVRDFSRIHYISQMYDFAKVLTLSKWTASSYYLMEYLPLLVVLPTSCAYLNDKHTRIQIYIETRVGKRDYWYGKLIAVFGMTFLVFTLPFLLEIGLSCLCFDLRSLGDPSEFGFHYTIAKDGKYFLSGLYLNNRILYVIILILLFGLAAGILAMWNVAITSLPFFRYKIFTFFPIYVLLFLISCVEKIFKPSFTMNYFFVLRMFEDTKTSYVAVLIFLISLVVMSFLIIEYRIRKEEVL